MGNLGFPRSATEEWHRQLVFGYSGEDFPRWNFRMGGALLQISPTPKDSPRDLGVETLIGTIRLPATFLAGWLVGWLDLVSAMAWFGFYK